MADALDSKSSVLQWTCGFDSHLRYSSHECPRTANAIKAPDSPELFAFQAMWWAQRKTADEWECSSVSGMTLVRLASTTLTRSITVMLEVV